MLNVANAPPVMFGRSLFEVKNKVEGYKNIAIIYKKHQRYLKRDVVYLKCHLKPMNQRASKHATNVDFVNQNANSRMVPVVTLAFPTKQYAQKIQRQKDAVHRQDI